MRTSFFDAATCVELSEPYRGGPADRPPTAADDAADSQEKTVAAVLRSQRENAATADLEV